MAVFSWLLARHAGGTFAVWVSQRVGKGNETSELSSDARPARARAAMDLGALSRRLEALRWLDLDWEVDLWVGEELDAYRACVQRLVDGDRAYRCQEPGGARPSVRLRLPGDRHVRYDDLWLGPQDVAIAEQDDPLLLKAGRPTALLACVVDAHEQGITHWVRSPDSLRTSALELVLIRALEWDPPTYAHLPEIAGTTAQEPLSSYQDRVLGLAMANYLARLGWTPRGRRTLLSLAALARQFEPGRVTRRPVSADPSQLGWFNRRQLVQIQIEEAAEILAPVWCVAYGVTHRAQGTGLSPQAWQQILADAIRSEICFLEEAAERARFAFVDDLTVDGDAWQTLAQAYVPEVLRAFVDGIAQVEPYTFEAIDEMVSALRWQFKRSHQIRSKDVMYVVRAALTGRADGPCLVAACQVLGRSRCVERVLRALEGQR